MKKDTLPATEPENELPREIARRLARHYVHDAILVLIDATWLWRFDQREEVTDITGALTVLERRLKDLELPPL